MVYIVFKEYDAGTPQVEAVFSTLEKAREHIREENLINDAWKLLASDLWYEPRYHSYVWIEDYQVDKEFT